MLTSFFRKSNPLNFLVLGIYLFLIHAMAYIRDSEMTFELAEIGRFLGVLLLLVFSLFLLNFTIRKNSLSMLNSFAMLIAACIMAMLTDLFEVPALVIASLFLLFAYRRIFSLQNSRNIEIKILDASLWIALAAMFYFWSWLLFLALYGGIVLMSVKKLRFYLIPPVAVGVSFLIATAYHFLVDGTFVWFVNWLGKISLDFSNYARPDALIFITFITAVLIWTIISKFSSIATGPKKRRPNHILSLYLLVVSLFVVLVAPDKTGAEFLFLLPSATIIITGYMEKKAEFWFKESLLWVFVLLPILFLFI